MYESHTLRAELFDNVWVILVLYVSTVPVWTFMQAEFLALLSVHLLTYCLCGVLLAVFHCQFATKWFTLLRYLNWNGDASAI